MGNVFFIIGSGRSGTTAMVEVLRTAPNALVYSEQSPKLCIAARMHYEGLLPYPKEFIYKSKKEEIEEVLRSGKIYGDKNLNYLHFIRELSELWDCRFLFLIRDGRDVVRSCMDFHAERGPGYARYEDDEESSLTQPEDSFWDFARLRPRKSTGEYRNWRKMQQFEKFAWACAEFNAILFHRIQNLDHSRYEIINMSTLRPEHVEGIFDFLGLKAFDFERVSSLLDSKLNTTVMEKTQRFPHWSQWNRHRLAIFDKYADKMMREWGYY